MVFAIFGVSAQTRAEPPPQPPHPLRGRARALACSLRISPVSIAELCAQSPGNTIKAEQVLFQAQKKASGNTHTARGMPLNIFAFVTILGGGALMMGSTLRKLYWGVGKIELDK